MLNIYYLSWYAGQGFDSFFQNYVTLYFANSPSLSLTLESLLRLKEEQAEVDEFTFSQGVSDQESNGSGSYYIKQEPC